MAVNPETGIDAAVDRFVYIEAFDMQTFDINDASTYRVLNWSAVWPRTDGGEIAGANERFMYFKRMPLITRDVDHRYSKAVNQTLAMDPNASGASLPVGTFQQEEVAVKLSVDELKAQIQTAFQAEVRERFPEAEDPSLTLQIGRALAMKSEGGQLTEAQVALVERFKAYGEAVSQLEEKRAEKYLAAETDKDFDITDWTIQE